MPNRNLTEAELQEARQLLELIRSRLEALADGDAELLFAYRRKISKELTYDERGTSAHRKKLKKLKRKEQNGICPICGEPLPPSYCVLDRLNAVDGYTPENTRLIHQSCDVSVQAERGYA